MEKPDAVPTSTPVPASTPVPGGGARLRPVPPDVEERRRRCVVVMLGVFLCLGVLLPVFVPGDVEFGDTIVRMPVDTGTDEAEPASRLVFINIALLMVKGIPTSIKVLLVYPLFVGVPVIFAGALGTHRVRGGVLVAVILVPSLLAVLGVGDLFPWDVDAVVMRRLMVLIGASIGWQCLFAGLRARSYRPGSDAAHVVAVCGSIAYLVCLVLPVYEAKMGRMLLLAPLRFFREAQTVLLGWLLVGATLCVILSAAFAIQAGLGRKWRTSRTLAKLTFALFVLGWILGGCAMIGSLVAAARLKEFTFAPLALLKTGMLFTGMTLLLPVGISELLIGDSGVEASPTE